MTNNYNHIAPFYDRLARLVFGRTQIDAQVWLLNAIPKGTNILIVGGGSGWILEKIAKVHRSGLTITYLDAAGRMIEMAKKRGSGNNTVHFVTSGIEQAVLPEQYDVVITPFLFDNFTDEGVMAVFAAIHNKLATGGSWLYCDFSPRDRGWQRWLMRSMYVFFRIVSEVKAKHMPNMHAWFCKYGYAPAAKKTFMHGFITSQIFKKE